MTIRDFVFFTGNEQCWHESLDIIFGSIDLFTSVVKAKTSDEGSPGGKIPVDINLDTFNNSDTRSQILAQIITFSFLKRQMHIDTMTSFLVPCIALTKEELKVFFYDSENDLLIENREHKIFGDDGEINYEAVIILWLVLNYKFTGSGVTSTLLAAPKSNFCHHAEKMLNVYKGELKYTGVSKGNTYKPIDYRYLSKTDAKFIWPPEYDTP